MYGAVLVLLGIWISTRQSRAGDAAFLLGAFGALGINIWIFLRLWFHVHLDTKRRLAARGDRTHAHLATVQPATEVVAPAVPLVIGLRMRRPILIGMWMLFASLVTLIVVAEFIGEPSWVSPWTLLVVVFGLAMIASDLRRASKGDQIEVDDRGITLLRLGKYESIPWQDARLFAIYRGDPRQPPRWYDVSSANAVLHWV
jgi:hypothetical protein